MLEFFDTVGAAVWFFLPAYIANMSPVFISKIKAIQKHNKPLDFNKRLGRNRILGEGKTWAGLITATLVGGLIGFLQSLTNILPRGSIALGLLLGLGAMLGDSAGSFIKRRLNIQRGGKAPFLDQLDFVLGAFLLSSIIMFNLMYLIIIIIITPILHLSINKLGYKLKLKREPW